MNIYKLSFAGVLTFSTMLGSFSALAKPATRAACEDAFSKGASAFRRMSDEDLVVFNFKQSAPENLEVLNKLSPAMRKLVTADLAESFRATSKFPAELGESFCTNMPILASAANTALKMYVEMGILTQDDLLDDGKTEL